MAAKLIALEDARALVLEYAAPLGHETVPLVAALGRVLAEPVSAPFDVPGFDNSSMDGFALRAADSGAGARLRGGSRRCGRRIGRSGRNEAQPREQVRLRRLHGYATLELIVVLDAVQVRDD